ncbi:MAG: hypothetical protein OER83_05560, partial [Flavobacteriaceae bacterium]|nr:hypothetical protein [Flavobacteriaceae bacterium]
MKDFYILYFKELFKRARLALLLLCAFTFFQVNGQIIVDGDPSDWETLLCDSPASPLAIHVQDNFGQGSDNQFTQGSKDYFRASSLTWNNGQTKQKGDIANGAAYLSVDGNGDVQLCFAGDRVSNAGDAQIGFWFYQN